jgi:hypothetical protein
MKCPICQKTGLRGHQGVTMHVGRVHDKTINPNKAHSIAKRRRRRLALMSGVTAIDGEPGAAVAVKEAEPAIDTSAKRAVTVVETKVTVQNPVSKKFEVNGCPNCLFPLRTMNADLARHGIKPPPFCPNCTFPVEVVRTALDNIENFISTETVHQ